MINASAVLSDRQTHQRTEWGRKAILSGCIMSLVGMVAYCYGTFGEGPQADLPSSLFANGVLGWFAFLLLLSGVGVWLVGNMAVLDEADRVKTTQKKPKPR
jgi:hypothetical protein